MKLTVKLNENLVVEVDGSNQREAFEELANAQEVFGNIECKKCKKNNLKYQVRTNPDNDKFYEIVCLDCFAKLSFGCTKKGSNLFPKRKDTDGKYFNDGGWLKWNKEKQIAE